MILNQNNFSTLNMSYNTAFYKAFSEAETHYEKVAMTMPSESRETTYAWLGQFPRMREWIGDREIQNLMAYSYAIKNKTFELTTSVPVNDIADDLYGVYTPLISEMGLSARIHPDELIFDLLARGFSEKSYDGVPFFSNKHTWRNAKFTQTNMGTKKLSSESYSEARTAMMVIKGEHGKSLNIVPDLLVVPPQLEAIAKELLFADLICGSTNINKNTCDLIVVPQLAEYPEQWYLLCTKRRIKPLIFQQRQAPKLVCKSSDKDDNVFFKDEIIYGVKARYNVGFGLWQLAYGSTGTGETIMKAQADEAVSNNEIDKAEG